MAQEHKQSKKASETDEATEVEASADVAERKEQLDEDIDAMRLTTDGNMVQEIARFAHLRRETRRRAAGRATGGVGL